MSHQQDYSIELSTYSDNAIDSVRQEKFGRRAAKPTYSSRRKGKAPQSFNGIHRRRRRKVSW
jgi:hypothetical protein